MSEPEKSFEVALAELEQLIAEVESGSLPLEKMIDRIEVGEKILPEGYEKMPRKNASYQQSIRIFYKFIGEIVSEPVRDMVPAGLKVDDSPLVEGV